MKKILVFLLYIKWVVLYLGIHSHQKKMIMSNLQVTKYMLGMIGCSIGMIVHLFQMIETSEVIHFVCFLLWFVMLSCLYFMLGKKLKRF
jgi:hypothetical protein